ncbi:hypothetical protein [Leptolyngbya ohadii]|uniref:hypothetical protein n=1 Tax=Leptolyngbya ohadii TaxID=1962290 RepID=UPI000B59B884|nr:hypothetical protein [Leptolyngbya ohadii]
MSQVQQLAKRGDPKAIAALINQSFNPKGLSVRAAVKGSCLQILVQSPNPINQQTVVSFISKGLKTLSPQGITTVRICAQQTDEVTPAWVEEVQMEIFPPIPPTAFTAPPTPSTSIPLNGKIQPASQTVPHPAQPEDDTVRCPRCTSAQIAMDKKGFSGGKAIAGAVLLGAAGLAGGFIGANNVRLSCLKCGFQWELGKPTPKFKHKPQPVRAKLNRPGFVSRFFTGAVLGLILGIPVGIMTAWIPGASGPAYWVVVLLTGITLATKRDFLLTLQGNCPHCGKELDISHLNTPQRCKHCKSQIRTEYNAVERTAWFHPVIEEF